MRISQISNLNSRINFGFNLTYTNSDQSGIGMLIHQTNMFREPETDEFVVNHIRESLGPNKQINLVSAACSSGEEAFSFLVLLDDLLEKIRISGFDLGENCIDDAKKGKVLISADASEEFLLNSKPTKTEFQSICREKFRKYFKPTGKCTVPNDSLHTKILKYISRDKYRRRLMYEYEIAPEAMEHVSFFNGDIRRLTDLYEQDSVDILLFRNAMYHLLCEIRTDNQYRIERKNSYSIAKGIAQQMNKVVKKGGLVVFGEDEYKTGVRVDVISQAMHNSGFKPIFIDDSFDGIFFDENSSTEQYDPLLFYSNIWEKVEDVE